MRVGITILPEYPWAEAKRRWQAAEEYGFDHAWTFDHLAWSKFIDGPWFGSVPTLAMAAGATSRLPLGLLVSTPSFRHPVSFVRDLTALDDISGGRFTLGLGSGSHEGYDTTAFGPANRRPANRANRFREFVELLDAMLTNDQVTSEGEYFSARNARSTPVRLPRLPFLIAANGPKGMRLAAEYGQGWVTTGEPSDTMDDYWASLTKLTGQFGRPEGIRRVLQTDDAPVYSLSSVECYRDFHGRAEELGFTDIVVPWPRAAGAFAGNEGILDEIRPPAAP